MSKKNPDFHWPRVRVLRGRSAGLGSKWRHANVEIFDTHGDLLLVHRVLVPANAKKRSHIMTVNDAIRHLLRKGTSFAFANLRGVNLVGNDLSGADFSFADLQAATLRGANCRGTKFTFANLFSADLCGAHVDEKTDFSDANITRAAMPGDKQW